MESRSEGAAPPPPSYLVAKRAGADPTTTNAALQDSGGQLTDNGGTPPAYDGTAGSADVRIDPKDDTGAAIVAGDPVGDVVYVWDDVGESGFGTLTGQPSTSRDSGWTAGGGAKYTIGDPGTTYRTIVVPFTPTFVPATEMIATASGAAGYVIRAQSGGAGRVQFRNGATTMYAFTSLAASWAGVPLLVAFSVNASGDTVGRIYRASDGLFIAGGSSLAESRTTLTDAATDMYVGSTDVAASPVPINAGTKLLAAALSASEMDDVADGTTASGWARYLTGLRSKCYIDGAPTGDLITKLGTGADVTAETV